MPGTTPSLMIDIVWNITFEYIVAAPGALLLWALKGLKGTYSETLADNHNTSVIIGLVFWAFIFGTIYWLNNA